MRGTNSRRRGGEGADPGLPPPLPERGVITAVLPQRRAGRVSLYLNGEFALGVAAEVAAALGLRVGCTVDSALLAQARERDAEHGARHHALALLAARSHAAAELARKLARKGYPEAAVRRALAALAEQGWLDDREFARQYVRARSEGRGALGERRLAQELRRKGLAPDLIREVLAEQFGAADTAALAAELARARLARMSGADPRTAGRRLGAFLARRGFDPETITCALRQVLPS